VSNYNPKPGTQSV